MTNVYSRMPSAGLEDLTKIGIHTVWIEVNEEGIVERELGFDANNHVIHRFPGGGPLGRYGIFDLVKFAPGAIEENLSAESFESAFRDSKAQ